MKANVIPICAATGAQVQKTCQNCANRTGGGMDAFCELSRNYCHVERMYPTECGKQFQGWRPRAERAPLKPRKWFWQK